MKNSIVMAGLVAAGVGVGGGLLLYRAFASMGEMVAGSEAMRAIVAVLVVLYVLHHLGVFTAVKKAPKQGAKYACGILLVLAGLYAISLGAGWVLTTSIEGLAHLIARVFGVEGLRFAHEKFWWIVGTPMAIWWGSVLWKASKKP